MKKRKGRGRKEGRKNMEGFRRKAQKEGSGIRIRRKVRKEGSEGRFIRKEGRFRRKEGRKVEKEGRFRRKEEGWREGGREGRQRM